jgi:hypothetical protein
MKNTTIEARERIPVQMNGNLPSIEPKSEPIHRLGSEVAEKMGEQTTSESTTRWVQAISYWFAAAAAIIYATGFLVEFTFLNSLGIKEAATDAFKAKYIYVGLLCLLSPVSGGVFLLGCLRIRQSGGPFYWSSVLVVLNLFVVFYVLNTFAPPGFFATHESDIAVIFGAFMIVLGAIRFFEGNKRQLVFRLVRWILLVLAGVCSFRIYRDLWPVLSEVFVEGGWLYLCLVATIIFLVGWLVTVLRQKWSATMFATSLSLQLTLCYLSVLVFAYRIYPFIPAGHGGGDFSRGTTLSILRFDPRFENTVPGELIADKRPNLPPWALELSRVVPSSKPLIIITENSSVMYVAVPVNPGEPEKLRVELAGWRTPNGNAKPKTIFGVKREAVVFATSKTVWP